MAKWVLFCCTVCSYRAGRCSEWHYVIFEFDNKSLYMKTILNGDVLSS